MRCSKEEEAADADDDDIDDVCIDEPEEEYVVTDTGTCSFLLSPMWVFETVPLPPANVATEVIVVVVAEEEEEEEEDDEEEMDLEPEADGGGEGKVCGSEKVCVPAVSGRSNCCCCATT